MKTQEHPPLLSTINTILLNKGFVPVDATSGLYKKESSRNKPLSLQFVRVTDRHVTPIENSQARQSHLKFVMENTKYIVPKVR